MHSSQCVSTCSAAESPCVLLCAECQCIGEMCKNVAEFNLFDNVCEFPFTYDSYTYTNAYALYKDGGG